MIKTIKILIAEDSPVDALMITHALETEIQSMEIARADCKSSFAEALTKATYDIILCDHFMNDTTSLEALDALKNSNSETPFIIVTSHDNHELAREAIEQGAYDYVLKSDLFRLPTAVKNAVNYSTVKQELVEIKKRLSGQ